MPTVRLSVVKISWEMHREQLRSRLSMSRPAKWERKLTTGDKIRLVFLTPEAPSDVIRLKILFDYEVI